MHRVLAFKKANGVHLPFTTNNSNNYYMTEEDKKEFEEFLKWKAEKAEMTKEAKTASELKDSVMIDVNAKVNANVTPSVNIEWYHKLTGSQKNLLMFYLIWFIVHLLLLASGKGRKGFFPGPRNWNYDSWDIDRYGLPEFIVYVVLAPVVVYFVYSIYMNLNNQTPSQLNNQQ